MRFLRGFHLSARPGLVQFGWLIVVVHGTSRVTGGGLFQGPTTSLPQEITKFGWLIMACMMQLGVGT